MTSVSLRAASNTRAAVWRGRPRSRTRGDDRHDKRQSTESCEVGRAACHARTGARARVAYERWLRPVRVRSRSCEPPVHFARRTTEPLRLLLPPRPDDRRLCACSRRVLSRRWKNASEVRSFAGASSISSILRSISSDQAAAISRADATGSPRLSNSRIAIASRSSGERLMAARSTDLAGAPRSAGRRVSGDDRRGLRESFMAAAYRSLSAASTAGKACNP